MNTVIQGLRTVIYYVKDIEKAKAWYTAVLGKAPYFDHPFYVGYNLGGFELGLHPASDKITWGTNTVAYWGVDDAHKAYEELVSKGGSEHEPVSDVGEGILVGAVKDPFGNIFGIIQNPHFKLEN